MVGQALPGRREPHPATNGFEQRGADLPSQSGDLLRHRRRADAEVVGDLAHRAGLRQTEQHLQPAQVHLDIVHGVNNLSTVLTWT